MDDENYEPEAWYEVEPGDLGFDPYAGTYVDDDPIDFYDYPDEPEYYPGEE